MHEVHPLSFHDRIAPFTHLVPDPVARRAQAGLGSAAVFEEGLRAGLRDGFSLLDLGAVTRSESEIVSCSGLHRMLCPPISGLPSS